MVRDIGSDHLPAAPPQVLVTGLVGVGLVDVRRVAVVLQRHAGIRPGEVQPPDLAVVQVADGVLELGGVGGRFSGREQDRALRR